MAHAIVLRDYDPDWPREFERLRARAAEALGDVALAIEHVGSTAVPGLAAKPVIDMVVVVAPQYVHTAIGRLVGIGYVHEGNLGVEGREAFRWPEGEPRHHLSRVATRQRGTESAARLSRPPYRTDRPGYTEAKTEFVERYSR